MSERLSRYVTPETEEKLSWLESGPKVRGRYTRVFGPTGARYEDSAKWRGVAVPEWSMIPGCYYPSGSFWPNPDEGLPVYVSDSGRMAVYEFAHGWTGTSYQVFIHGLGTGYAGNIDTSGYAQGTIPWAIRVSAAIESLGATGMKEGELAHLLNWFQTSVPSGSPIEVGGHSFGGAQSLGFAVLGRSSGLNVTRCIASGVPRSAVEACGPQLERMGVDTTILLDLEDRVTQIGGSTGGRGMAAFVGQARKHVKIITVGRGGYADPVKVLQECMSGAVEVRHKPDRYTDVPEFSPYEMWIIGPPSEWEYWSNGAWKSQDFPGAGVAPLMNAIFRNGGHGLSLVPTGWGETESTAGASFLGAAGARARAIESLLGPP